MKRIPWLASLLITLGSCCCCSWEGLIDTAFNIFNTTEPVSAERFAREMTAAASLPDEIQNFQAVRYELIGFANYYLRYEVNDKNWVLDWVASLPAGHSDEIQSGTCHPTSIESVRDDFSPNPKVVDLSQVTFWRPEQVKDKEYYSCLRFPWSHSLLFDLDSKTVYHVIQEIRE